MLGDRGLDQISVASRLARDAHRPLLPHENLSRVLTWQEGRRLTDNLTLHYKRVMYIMEQLLSGALLAIQGGVLPRPESGRAGPVAYAESFDARHVQFGLQLIGDLEQRALGTMGCREVHANRHASA